MSEFEKTCTFCKAKIKLSDKEGGKWLPFNLDGSSHDCRNKQGTEAASVKTQEFTLEAVQKKLESIGVKLDLERIMK